jgi:excisionase family DNA binding protein
VAAPGQTERLLTIPEVAELLNCSVRRVYRLVEERDPSRRLPHIKVGRHVRFKWPRVEAWLEERSR